MKNYLALFDLDGTLFDTNDVNYFAYKTALNKYGFDISREYFVNKCMSRNYTEFLPEIMGTSEHVREIHDIKKAAYSKNLDKARINTLLFSIIEQIKDSYYLAIITTASRKNTMEILDYFNCRDIFDLVVAQEDMTRLKPDPEGFLIGMNHFSVDSKHTIIFEDSETGLQAARQTGATVMAIDRW